MRLFLDSSVVLAACGRATGASRALFETADEQGWVLQASEYVIAEVGTNLTKLRPESREAWDVLRGQLSLVPDVVSFAWANILAPAKDRPILFTAAAWSDVLLTLDGVEFAELLGGEFDGP